MNYPKVEIDPLSQELDDEWTDIFFRGSIALAVLGICLYVGSFFVETVPLALFGTFSVVIAAVLAFLSVPTVLTRSAIGVVNYSIHNADGGAHLCLVFTPRKSLLIPGASVDVECVLRTYERARLREDRHEVNFHDQVCYSESTQLASDLQVSAGGPVELRASLGIEPGAQLTTPKPISPRAGETCYLWRSRVTIEVDAALDWKRDLDLIVTDASSQD